MKPVGVVQAGRRDAKTEISDRGDKPFVVEPALWSHAFRHNVPPVLTWTDTNKATTSVEMVVNSLRLLSALQNPRRMQMYQ